MRALHVAIASLFVLAFGASCAGIKPYVNPHPELKGIVGVWVDPHPDVDATDVLAGCNMWEPKGILCLPAAKRDAANMRVHFVSERCEEPDDPTHPRRRAVACSARSGDITFDIDCLRTAVGAVDRGAMRRFSGHEFGHQFGIWEHIDPDCDGVPILPDGRKYCGLALMNPGVHPDVQFITEMDSVAFDLRRTPPRLNGLRANKNNPHTVPKPGYKCPGEQAAMP